MAKRSVYRYEGWEAMARFNIKLPWSLELAPYLSVTQEYYQGPATVLERDYRADTRWNTGATLTWNIDEHWAVDLGYQFVHNASSSAYHRYDQHVVTTALSWSF